MENRLASLVENKGWFKLSRFGGAMRYQWLRRRRLLAFLLVILLAALVINLALGFFGLGEINVYLPGAEVGGALVLVFLCSFPVARHETTFLCRFGTPRTAVWLSSVLSLFLTGTAFLAVSVVINTLDGLAGQLLAPVGKGIVPLPDTTAAQYLSRGLYGIGQELPMQLLWLAEYTAVFYLVACCLRRWRIPTIVVLVGVPALLFTTLLLPVINEVEQIMQGGGQNQLVALLLRFIAWLEKAADFVAHNWQTIQGTVAGLALVLSYPVMRGTRQPE